MNSLTCSTCSSGTPDCPHDPPLQRPSHFPKHVQQGAWLRSITGGEDVGSEVIGNGVAGAGDHQGGCRGDREGEGGGQVPPHRSAPLVWRPCWCVPGQKPSFYAVNGNGFPCIADAFARRGRKAPPAPLPPSLLLSLAPSRFPPLPLFSLSSFRLPSLPSFRSVV